jgi:hypothetical protein
MVESEKGLYARAHTKIKEMLPVLIGMDFTTRDIWDRLGLKNTPEHAKFKKAIDDVLINLTSVNKEPVFKKTGNKTFRVIEKDAPEIEWWIEDNKKPLSIKWPRGHDSTSFGFEESIEVYPGDGIIVAGEGNQGKTSFALNMMVENMNSYKCTYFSSEFNPVKFRSRIKRFDWVDVMKDGRPKFELLPRQQNYDDLIAARKDNLIIIDWIRMDDDPWKIRAVIDSILKPLDNGVAIIIQQKRSYKNVGEGGEGSVDLASVYLTIGYQQLYVEKVKSPKMYDPNRKRFGFEITGGGAKFGNIREVVPCPKCHGRKSYGNGECDNCMGKGYTDK